MGNYKFEKDNNNFGETRRLDTIHKEVQKIEKEIKNCTSIIVTHRESSIKRADKILNLNDANPVFSWFLSLLFKNFLFLGKIFAFLFCN
mgnify:CR=1 FL=1